MTLPDKKYRVFEVPVVLDPELETAYLEAQYELEETAKKLLESAGDRIRVARSAAAPGREEAAGDLVVAGDEAILAELREKREAAKAALDEATTAFRFRALGRKQYRELLKAHPPTAEDQKEWEEAGNEGKAPWNEEALARDLIRRACVSPLLDEADISEIFDGESWNQTEVSMLWVGAQAAQVQGPR